MPIELVQSILSTENRAAEIVASAEKERTLMINRAKTAAEKIISEARISAKTRASEIVAEALAEAEKEAFLIKEQSARDVEAVRKKVSSKLEEAKKLCRQ